MFTATRGLFRSYLQTVVDGGTIPTAINNDRRNLALELGELIDELDFILERVHELEPRISELSCLREATDPILESRDETRARTELRVITKSFYYCAWRAREIARNTVFPFPGLGSFECTGVRDVRNKLLEHPERSDPKVLVVSFGRGCANGPVVKPLREVGQEDVSPDTGLFANAKEFRLNLEHLLRRALEQNAT